MMEKIYFDTGFPFKTNGVYVRELPEGNSSNNLKSRLKEATFLTFGKRKQPLYSFISFDSLYNDDINAPLEKRFSISLIVMAGELFETIKHIKNTINSSTVKDVVLEDNVLQFAFSQPYLDDKNQIKFLEGDKYCIKFYNDSCEVDRMDRKTGSIQKTEYRFISVSPTFNERLNSNRLKTK